jgi:Putative peptidoglycan binding domain
MALARPRGIAAGINHGERNHDQHNRDEHDHYYRDFAFPYWWYGRVSCVNYESSPPYGESYWQDLAMKIQVELARRGYYHGRINGVIDSSCRQAIRGFQKSQGLPQTGLVDPGLLRSLGIS